MRIEGNQEGKGREKEETTIICILMLNERALKVYLVCLVPHRDLLKRISGVAPREHHKSPHSVQ